MVVVGHAFYFPYDPNIQNVFFGSVQDPIFDLTDFFFELQIYAYLPPGIYPVSVFFLLSGFVMEFAMKDLKIQRFLFGRVLRIFPVFWVAFLVHVAVIHHLGGDLPSWSDVLDNAFLISSWKIVGVSWTLIVELRYYLIISVLAFFGVGAIGRAMALVSLAFIMPNAEGFWYGYMALGMLAFHLSKAMSAGDAKGVGIYLSATFVAASVWWCLVGWRVDIFSTHNVPIKWLVAAYGTFIASLLMSRFAKGVRTLQWLGDISYPLYVIHLATVPLGYYYLSGSLNLVTIATMLVAVNLPLAWLLHSFVEQPSLNLSRSVTGRVVRVPVVPEDLVKHHQHPSREGHWSAP